MSATAVYDWAEHDEWPNDEVVLMPSIVIPRKFFEDVLQPWQEAVNVVQQEAVTVVQQEIFAALAAEWNIVDGHRSTPRLTEAEYAARLREHREQVFAEELQPRNDFRVDL